MKKVWIGLVIILLIFGACSGLKVIQGEIKPLVVLSGSMKPTLQIGDLVIFKSVTPEEVKIGDIIVFKDPQGRKNVLITHRVINQTEQGFQTKGDACEEPDQWIVKSEDVVGKPVLRIPYIGYITGSRYLKQTERLLVWISLVILPACLLIGNEVKNLLTDPIKLRKKEKRKRMEMRRKKKKFRTWLKWA